MTKAAALRLALQASYISFISGALCAGAFALILGRML